MAEKKIMRKWTWDRVQNAVNKNLPNWTIAQVKPDYIDSNIKINLLCPRGHENEKEARKVELGKNSLGCKNCIREGIAKKTYQTFIEALKSNGWKMISPFEEIMQGNLNNEGPSHTSLKVECPNGKPHKKSYGNFRNKPHCSCLLCCPDKTVKSLKGTKQKRILDIVQARKRFQEKGYELLSTEWKGVETYINGQRIMGKYDVRCLECGYERPVTAARILRGLLNCPVCSGAKGTLETFTKWTKDNRPEFEIPQNQIYKGNRSTAKVKCLKHDVIFDIFPGNFKRDYNSCPACKFEQNAENTRNIRKQFNTFGVNNIKWNGLAPLRNYLRTQLEDWKKASMKKHGYVCFITGKPFDEIHHGKGFNEILVKTMDNTRLPIYETVEKYSPEELELIRSTFLKLHDFYGLGYPLCNEIHDEFHSMYGYGGNTIDQFVHYLSGKGHDDLAEKVKSEELKRKPKMKKKYPEFSYLE